MLIDKIQTIRRTDPKQLAVMFKYKLHRLFMGRSGNTKAEVLKEWDKYHSKWELEFHKRPNYRWDDEHFHRQWSVIFGEFMGFGRDHFKSDDTLLDLGCGSRPALDWFNNSAQKYNLDPLLADFCEIEEMKRFWDGKPDDSMLSVPAETPIEWLYDSCSFVNCWNVLDHTYDWEKIMENIAAYVTAGSYCCIGTDFQSHGIGHPGIGDSDIFFNFVGRYFDIEKTVNNLFGRELALKLVRNETQIINEMDIA